MSLDDFTVSYFTSGNGVATLSVKIYSMTKRGISPKINALSTLLFAIIMAISGTPITNSIGIVLIGFIGGFVEAYLIAIFYNYLSPKLGKLKIELID